MSLISHDQEAEAQIFISYSRRDTAFAQWLVDALKEKGFAAYLDKLDIAPGENWKARLAALILAADTVVFIVTAHSVASDICAWELDESARLKKRLFPIVAERIPDSSAPANLRDLNWIFCSHGDDRDEAIASLSSALRTDLPWLREHTRLAGLASRWQRQSRAKALTLRGSDLHGAEEWLTRRPTELARPTDLHRDFIRASRRAATIRQRWFGGGAALIVVFSLVLAGWAEINRQDAQLRRDEATAQRVEAEKQRDRAEGALKDVKLQRDRAEMAVDNVVGLGESLYMVTTDFSDLLRSPKLIATSRAFQTIKRLVNLGDELAKVMQEQVISDKTIYMSRARSLMYAAKLFTDGGDSQLAIATATRSVQLMRDNVRADSIDVAAVNLFSEALEALGDSQWRAGNIDGAREAYEESVSVLEGANIKEADISRHLAFVFVRIALFSITNNDQMVGERYMRRSMDLLCRRERQAVGSDKEEARRDIGLVTKFATEQANMAVSC